jgi:hypothetical protein
LLQEPVYRSGNEGRGRQEAKGNRKQDLLPEIGDGPWHAKGILIIFFREYFSSLTEFKIPQPVFYYI